MGGGARARRGRLTSACSPSFPCPGAASGGEEGTYVSQGGTAHEVAAMRRAITLAERGLGATSPNPVVGCVIIDAVGAVVGTGFHAAAGDAHAEVVALREAAARAVGATVVVTLEPCRHTGRTGPCTKALIEAGIARVVFAV